MASRWSANTTQVRPGSALHTGQIRLIGLVFSGIAILFDYGTFPSQADVQFRSIGKHGTLNSSLYGAE
jgi:hypothetical protein